MLDNLSRKSKKKRKSIILDKYYSYEEIKEYQSVIIEDISMAKYFYPIFEEKYVEINLQKNFRNKTALKIAYNHMHEGQINIEGMEKGEFIIDKIPNGKKIKKIGINFNPTAFEKIENGVHKVILSRFCLDEKRLSAKNGKVVNGEFYYTNGEKIEVFCDDRKLNIRKFDKSELDDLYDVNKVFFFANQPTKGGILDQINNYVKYFKHHGKEVNLVFEDYNEADPKTIIDLNEFDVDNIYIMSDKSINFSEIFNEESLLFFTQIRIAASFINFFEDHKVIFQYHRNIMHITPENKNRLNLLASAIKQGEIQLLEPQQNIDKLFEGNSKFVEFRNYIFEEENPVNTGTVEKVKNIGYISRLSDIDKSKNIDGVLRIIEEVSKKPGYKFHIYGSGDREDDFKDLGDNVVFHGYEYDKRKIYKDLDLVMLPSLSEAYPMVLIEAINNGVKVISYRSTNMIDTIISDETGKSIELDDENSFVQEILGMQGYDREAVRKYSKENFCFDLDRKLEYYSVKKEATYRPNRQLYVYDTLIEGRKLVFKIFSSGYYLDKNLVQIGSTVKYKMSFDEASEYYSPISKNFRRQFYRIEFNLKDFELYDYVKFYKNEELANLVISKQGATKVPLTDELFLSVGRNEIKVNSVDTSLALFDYVQKYKRKKEAYLFQDRENKASDNGEALYEYAASNKELKKADLYYVIEENTPDYFRMLSEGKRVVIRGTYKHKMLFLTVNTVFTSHVRRDILVPFNDNNYKFYKKSKTVFLQHGIIFNKSDYFYFLNNITTPVDGMVVSCQDEKKLIEEITNYEHIMLTGLARYDKLGSNSNTTEEYITYFPTWNRTIDMTVFEETIYFKKINEFIMSDGLSQTLKNNNVKLKFILHPEVQKYKEYFAPVDCVEMVDIDSLNFSKLLSETKMIITDTSSIVLDVLYQKKPVIAYNPYTTHGDIAKSFVGPGIYNTIDLDELNGYIKGFIEGDYKISQEKKEFIENFYAYTDQNNSERIFDYVKTNMIKVKERKKNEINNDKGVSTRNRDRKKHRKNSVK